AEDGIRDLYVTGVQTCALPIDRKSTRLNSSHVEISYAVFCLKTEEHTSKLPAGRDAGDHLVVETAQRRPRALCPLAWDAATARAGDHLHVELFFFFLKVRAPRRTSPYPPRRPSPA